MTVDAPAQTFLDTSALGTVTIPVLLSCRAVSYEHHVQATPTSHILLTASVPVVYHRIHDGSHSGDADRTESRFPLHPVHRLATQKVYLYTDISSLLCLHHSFHDFNRSFQSVIIQFSGIYGFYIGFHADEVRHFLFMDIHAFCSHCGSCIVEFLQDLW